VGLKGERFIFSLPAHKLHDESDEEFQKLVSSKLNHLKGDINDNPVLVIAKFKNL
jgi:hypothetical protein